MNNESERRLAEELLMKFSKLSADQRAGVMAQFSAEFVSEVLETLPEATVASKKKKATPKKKSSTPNKQKCSDEVRLCIFFNLLVVFSIFLLVSQPKTLLLFSFLPMFSGLFHAVLQPD